MLAKFQPLLEHLNFKFFQDHTLSAKSTFPHPNETQLLIWIWPTVHYSNAEKASRQIIVCGQFAKKTDRVKEMRWAAQESRYSKNRFLIRYWWNYVYGGKCFYEKWVYSMTLFSLYVFMDLLRFAKIEVSLVFKICSNKWHVLSERTF